MAIPPFILVSIPFDQGNVFRRDLTVTTINALGVSIPFDQGNVFRLNLVYNTLLGIGVSIPFDQGNVFRPVHQRISVRVIHVSIPFDQGNVFRPPMAEHFQVIMKSQSLSIRAMSFDCSGMLEAGIMRPFRPTSQFFWKVKELALDLSK